jgi:hypothetical protein
MWMHTGASAGSGRPAPELLAALADVALVRADQATPAGPSALYDLDIVAIVSGPTADRAELVVEAGRAVVGVVLAVDPHPDATVLASGAVVILRGGGPRTCWRCGTARSPMGSAVVTAARVGWAGLLLAAGTWPLSTAWDRHRTSDRPARARRRAAAAGGARLAAADPAGRRPRA